MSLEDVDKDEDDNKEKETEVEEDEDEEEITPKSLNGFKTTERPEQDSTLEKLSLVAKNKELYWSLAAKVEVE